MSAARPWDLINIYERWLVRQEGSPERMLEADEFLDLWSKTPVLTRLAAVVLMSRLR